MEAKISVVLPVYNVEKYLKTCIETVLNQTYKNLEIILVDDGSTDGTTVRLCDELAEKNDCIHVIHKKNGGLSSARNMGVEIAKGEYVVFVDSDDYIEKNMLSSLFQDAKENDVRMVIGGMVIDGHKKIIRPDALPASAKLDTKTALHYFLLGHWHSACTNLYHRSVFDELTFPEKESNEDYYFNFFAIRKVQSVYVDLNVFYHYVKREDSITTTRASLKNLDWVSHTKAIYNLIADDAALGMLMGEAEYQYLFSNIVLANKALLSLKDGYTEEADKLYKIVSFNLKTSKKMLRKNAYLSAKYRTMGTFIANMSELYRWVIIKGLKAVKS